MNTNLLCQYQNQKKTIQERSYVCGSYMFFIINENITITKTFNHLNDPSVLQGQYRIQMDDDVKTFLQTPRLCKHTITKVHGFPKKEQKTM